MTNDEIIKKLEELIGILELMKVKAIYSMYRNTLAEISDEIVHLVRQMKFYQGHRDIF